MVGGDAPLSLAPLIRRDRRLAILLILGKRDIPLYPGRTGADT
jgi:hypothetical protein